MDTPTGEEERPSPSPKPGVNPTPGARPKVSPRIPAKPHPALPQRPPVAAKPTKATSNGVRQETGAVSFRKVPPPLPSVPPCATARDAKPNLRRISYFLATSSEDSATLAEQLAQPQAEAIEQVDLLSNQSREASTIKYSSSAKRQLAPHEEPGRGIDTASTPLSDVTRMNPIKQVVAAGRPRPKPPVKPPVKPKPMIKSKPLYTAVHKRGLGAASRNDNRKVEVEEGKTEAVRVRECERVTGGNKDVVRVDTEGVVCLRKLESQNNSYLSVKPEKSINEGLAENTETAISKGLTVTPEKIINEDLSVKAETAINKGLTVTPEKKINKDLSVKTVTEISNGLTVTPEKTINEDLSVKADMAISKGLRVTPKKTIHEDFSVKTEMAINKGSTVTSEKAINKDLPAKAEKTINEDLSVAPEKTINKDDFIKETGSLKSCTNVQQEISVQDGSSVDIIASNSVEPASEIPRRPPRKKKLCTPFSQTNFPVDSNNDSCTAAATCLPSERTGAVTPNKLRKDDTVHDTASEEQPVPDRKLKRVPSRKAPPPPTLSITKQESVKLPQPASTTQPVRSTTNIPTITKKLETNVSECKANMAQRCLDVEGGKNRDSSQQPGKLNIRGLEASMGLSIGIGLQHQMREKARTKPNPRPPLLTPKPKLVKPRGNYCHDGLSEITDGSKSTGNRSYTEALQLSKSLESSEHPFDMNTSLPHVEDSVVDKCSKLNRNNSYSQALEEIEDDVNGVLDLRKSTVPTEQRLAMPGLVQVLPADLGVASLQMNTNTESSESLPHRNRNSDALTGRVMKRSHTVEALLSVEVAKDQSFPMSSANLKKANSVVDILASKTCSLENRKPIFVPPPPPPYSDLDLNEELQQRTKVPQCPSEDAMPQAIDSSADELNNQVFVQENDENDCSSNDYYEPIELPMQFDIEMTDSGSDHSDHIYEVMPMLPPKIQPKPLIENTDVSPMRPPKRPKMRRPVPPEPPERSPPNTLKSSLGTPPLPPRRHPLPSPSNSPVLARSSSDMYDLDGYFQPVSQPKAGEIYSYADFPGHLPKRKAISKNKSLVPETKPGEMKSSNIQKRQSTLSITSDLTSSDSHIYEPIGSAQNSLTRENPSSADPQQRISGNSTFYCGIDEELEKHTEILKQNHKGNNHVMAATSVKMSKMPSTDAQSVIASNAAEQALDTAIPPPSPQAPKRLKRIKTQVGSNKSEKTASVTSSSSDDYIYPEDPDMVSPEKSIYKVQGSECTDDFVSELKNEAIYHEPGQNDESIYHEPDEVDESIYHEPLEEESIYHEPLESIYQEAEDSAVDCHSGSASEVVSPSSPPPPPVPPRDHHRSEPVLQAVKQAIYLQRHGSALSDTNIPIKKGKAVPKTVSFESQLTDSALSLSPANEDAISPLEEKNAKAGLKQRSISNPLIGRKLQVDDSFQDDSTSNSSDRPSSWASSGDGFEELSDIRRQRQLLDDTESMGSSLHPNSAMYLPGSGSDRSDLSDNEHEEWVKVKRKAEKREKKILNVAREIMTSEETFVDILKLLNIDFRQAVSKATEKLDHVVIPPTVMNHILQYLPQVQNFNEELLNDLKERIENWETNPRIADIFLRKGPFLKMYTFYIREFESSMAALDEACRKFPEFDAAVKDFEASPRCKHLLIKHYMLKPIQRIPQYRLLLQEYQKYLTPDHLDFKDTEAALVIVSEVADHANQSMKYGDNFKKLWMIQSSLIGQFEVIHPGREFIKEGMLHKLSRKVMQPRMFFLLSDVLLYTTPVSGGYKLNNHINLAGTRVILPTKADFQNELSIISTERSFTVSASTAAERDEWLSTLQAAIRENAKRRSSFNVRQLHKVPSLLAEVDKDLTLGTRAPVWVPDVRVSMCMLCTAQFSVTFRRHHCRACGKVVCGYCSDYRAPLRYLVYKAARVCSECYHKLSKDFDQDDLPDLAPNLADSADKDSAFSRSSIKSRFRGISWGSYRKASKAKRPAVLQEVTANDEVADMSGYLKVWKARKWKKLWFVLKGKALYTFKASEDAAATESIVLLGYEVQTFDSWFEGVEPSLVFEIRHVGTAPKILRTESSDSRDKWLNAIREATIP